MKKAIMFAILAIAPVSLFAKKIECENSWYVGARAHQNINMNFEFVGNDLLGGQSHKESISPLGYGLYGGCRFDEYFFGDIELSYWQSKIGDDVLSAKPSAFSTMYNLYVGNEFFRNAAANFGIMPYIGIGAGFSLLTVEVDTPYYYLDTYNTSFNLAYQFMTGIKFAVLQNIDFDIGVKYINYGKVKNTTLLNNTAVGETSISAMEGFVGLAYKF